MATSYQVRTGSQHPSSTFTSNSQYGHWSLPSGNKTPHTHPHTHNTGVSFTGNYNAAARRLGTGVGYTSRYSTVTPDMRNFVVPSRSTTAPNPSGKFSGFFDKNNPGRTSPVSLTTEIGFDKDNFTQKPYELMNKGNLTDFTSSSLRRKTPLTDVGNLRPGVQDARLTTREGLYNKYSDGSLGSDYGTYSKATGQTFVNLTSSSHHDSKCTPLEDRITSYDTDPYGLAEAKLNQTLDRAYTTLEKSKFSKSRDLGYDRTPTLERSQTFHGQFPSSYAVQKTDCSDGRLGGESEFSTVGKLSVNTPSSGDNNYRRNFSNTMSENRPSSPLSISENRQSPYNPNRAHQPLQWMFGSRNNHVFEPPKTPYQPNNYLYQFESSKLPSPRSTTRDVTDIPYRNGTLNGDLLKNERDLLIARRTPNDLSYKDEGMRSYLDFPESASNLTTGTYSLQPTPPSSAAPSNGANKKSILKKTSKYTRDGSATFPRSYARESSYLSGVSTGPQRELPHLASAGTMRRSSSRRVTFNL